jgi:hypothetical protein
MRPVENHADKLSITEQRNRRCRERVFNRMIFVRSAVHSPAKDTFKRRGFTFKAFKASSRDSLRGEFGGQPIDDTMRR